MKLPGAASPPGASSRGQSEFKRSAPVTPHVHDPRLELTLFASDPEIVTPIGMAIDSRDRIFVIESHTHTPPRNYSGPKSDRIKVFCDSKLALWQARGGNPPAGERVFLSSSTSCSQCHIPRPKPLAFERSVGGQFH